MTIQEYITEFNGKYVDVDGFPPDQPYQCTDLAEKFCDLNKWPRLPGNAVNFFGEDLADFDSIPNTPDGVPQAGDFVIWHQDAAVGTGTAGHVAIATGTGDTNGFQSFDQNWPEGSAPHVMTHSYEGVIGWLRSKHNQGEEDVKVDQNILALLTSAILNRQPTPGDSGYIGQDIVKVITDFYNSGEHQAIIAAYDEGKKVPDLNTQIESLKAAAQAVAPTSPTLTQTVVAKLPAVDSAPFRAVVTTLQSLLAMGTAIAVDPNIHTLLLQLYPAAIPVLASLAGGISLITNFLRKDVPNWN